MALELDTRQRAMLQEMGVQVWLPDAPRLASKAAPAVSPRPVPSVAPPAPVQAEPPAPPSREDPAATAPDWATLSAAVRNCQACALCQQRRHTTLLAPAPSAVQRCDWMVVGDPPQEEDDALGAPFAGADGVLLAHMLRALGLQRANPLPGVPAQAPSASMPAQRAYVSQVLKCRPALGALPQPAELAQCARHLQQEIALVQPKIILSMGRFANQVLLSESPDAAALPPGKLRGVVHHYRGVPVVLSYAPQQLLRNGDHKAKAWADLCFAAQTLQNLHPR